MAERVVEKNYEEMINALNGTSKSILEYSKEMLNALQVCTSALGEGDLGAAQAAEKVTLCVSKYEEVVTEATRIAGAMQEELKIMQKERTILGTDN